MVEDCLRLQTQHCALCVITSRNELLQHTRSTAAVLGLVMICRDGRLVAYCRRSRRRSELHTTVELCLNVAADVFVEACVSSESLRACSRH
jgi:hypothetical protein